MTSPPITLSFFTYCDNVCVNKGQDNNGHEKRKAINTARQ